MKPAGRPRDETKKQVIFEATLSLLKHQSVKSITIEAIAKEAGVGKTTLYRWWPKKCSLIIDATLQKLLSETHIDNKKQPKEVLLKHFLSLVSFFSIREGQILLELLSEAQFDEAILTELREKVIEPRRQTIKQVIEAGIAQQQLKQQANVDWLMDAIYGPLYYRALIKHEKLDQTFARQHINFWLKEISN